MAERTFGWVQEAYTISNLKNVVRVFVLDSTINKLLREDKISRLISDEYHKDEMIKLLSMGKMEIPYTLLKGKDTPLRSEEKKKQHLENILVLEKKIKNHSHF